MTVAMARWRSCVFWVGCLDGDQMVAGSSSARRPCVRLSLVLLGGSVGLNRRDSGSSWDQRLEVDRPFVPIGLLLSR